MVTDEQPIDASAFVLAFRAAHAATGDRRYLARMRESFEWFLGANRLGLALYDFSTAGCHDGLGAQEVNENQGAESMVSFLLALLAMLGLMDDGLDWNDVKKGLARPDSARAEVLIEPSEAARTQNFVSAVTHELRTPLAAIRLYGEMLLEGWTDDPEKEREYHRRILRETNRLATLVERVLQKGRLTSATTKTQAVDLSRLVVRLEEELAIAHPPDAPLSEGNSDLRFELGEGLPPALASPEVVSGILTNLIENARKYAPFNPDDPRSEPILVRTRQEGTRVLLEVADRGPGIPAQHRDRIFEAFYRMGNEATRTATGTGLGLHLVRLQAEAVGAQATVRARDGGGSTFRVRFRPAGAPPAKADPAST